MTSTLQIPFKYTGKLTGILTDALEDRSFRQEGSRKKKSTRGSKTGGIKQKKTIFLKLSPLKAKMAISIK